MAAVATEFTKELSFFCIASSGCFLSDPAAFFIVTETRDAVESVCADLVISRRGAAVAGRVVFEFCLCCTTATSWPPTRRDSAPTAALSRQLLPLLLRLCLPQHLDGREECPPSDERDICRSPPAPAPPALVTYIPPAARQPTGGRKKALLRWLAAAACSTCLAAPPPLVLRPPDTPLPAHKQLPVATPRLTLLRCCE